MSKTTLTVPNPPTPEAYTPQCELMFFGPDVRAWRRLRAEPLSANSSSEEEHTQAGAKAAKEDLRTLLLASLQMQHVAVLAGSGTSLGPAVKGPTMQTLWNYCVNQDPEAGKVPPKFTPDADRVMMEIGYDNATENQNIEALLSRCEAYLQVWESANISAFVTASKKVILEKCSEFVKVTDDAQLAAHRKFLHRLSRRRARDSRLKLFTTNYDLCFETAAGLQGLVALDGFSFTQPRHFDPRFFLYDIVRRPTTGDEVGTPLEGVFHLYKLHGSVNWSKAGENQIEVVSRPTPETACLVYPAKGKYQQSYVQPHLELVSQYFSVLREPNTCLIVAGFGFNDDHLSEPILAAVRTNPHLRLIIVNPSASTMTAQPESRNKYWNAFFALANQGEDVWLVNASFGDFAEMIPDLKSLTPAQRLTRDIKLVAKAT